MLSHLDACRERFFNWCDLVVQAHTSRDKAVFKAWWPRKNLDGSYELVLELVGHEKAPFLEPDGREKAPFKLRIPIPDEYHELLEREYFIDHPPDKDEDEH